MTLPAVFEDLAINIRFALESLEATLDRNRYKRFKKIVMLFLFCFFLNPQIFSNKGEKEEFPRYGQNAHIPNLNKITLRYNSAYTTDDIFNSLRGSV